MIARRFTWAAVAGFAVVGAVNLSPWSLRAATATPANRETARVKTPETGGRGVRGTPPDGVGSFQEVAVRYVTAGTGSKARYKVRERLMGKELDNDAVGETSAIVGSIALDKEGAVVPAASSFNVTLTGLKSDKSRRDRYVQSRILETDAHPTTRLAVTAVRGLPSPLPTAGKVQFQIVGDLTLKGSPARPRGTSPPTSPATRCAAPPRPPSPSTSSRSGSRR